MRRARGTLRQGLGAALLLLGCTRSVQPAPLPCEHTWYGLTSPFPGGAASQAGSEGVNRHLP